MSCSSNFRVITHEDRIRLRTINGVIEEVNNSNDLLDFVELDMHVLDRARDHFIDEDHLLVVLAYTLKTRLEQLHEAIKDLPVGADVKHVKFTILYSNEFCFHCTVKNKVVKIRTVVPYRPINYYYEAFCIKVGKLVKK